MAPSPTTERSQTTELQEIRHFSKLMRILPRGRHHGDLWWLHTRSDDLSFFEFHLLQPKSLTPNCARVLSISIGLLIKITRHLEPHHYPDYIRLFSLSRRASFHDIISPIQLLFYQGAGPAFHFQDTFHPLLRKTGCLLRLEAGKPPCTSKVNTGQFAGTPEHCEIA